MFPIVSDERFVSSQKKTGEIPVSNLRHHPAQLELHVSRVVVKHFVLLPDNALRLVGRGSFAQFVAHPQSLHNIVAGDFGVHVGDGLN